MAEIKKATIFEDYGFSLKFDNGCEAHVEWTETFGVSVATVRVGVPHQSPFVGRVQVYLPVNGHDSAHIDAQKIPAFLSAVAAIDPANIPDGITV